MEPTHVERARQRLGAGDIAGARRDGEAALASAKDDMERAAAHLVLAACGQKSNDATVALAHIRAAIACSPRDPVAHLALAEHQEASGDKNAAVTSLQCAVEFNPRFVQGQHYLGILLGENGDTAGAIDAFERTVRLAPDHERAWNNLGNAQRNAGRLADAQQSFARALALRPDYPLAAANLGAVQRDRGELKQAEATLRAALARQAGEPPFRPLLVLLAGLLRERGALDEAAQLYLRAIKAAPEQSAGEWFLLGGVLAERGEPERAREAYARARATAPQDLRSAFALNLTLPMIYGDAGALAAARAAFERGLATLDQGLEALVAGLTEAQVLDGLRWTNFFLAYQGQHDRELQARYARLAARAVDAVAPGWRSPLAVRPVSGRRIRIGFASAFFREGTCGRYFKSWITDLARDRFEVFVYHLFPRVDDVSREIRHRADRFRTFGGNGARPSVVAPVIRGDDLDILIYPELGMDVTSFALAALRLAPRQYAAWGHPVTTGHATIDRFITCEAMEPDGCETHYTEQLVRLPGIGTRYPRIELPAPAPRRELGLPDDHALLICPQSLFKIHPDNDDLFAQVLAENPDALLVFFAGRHPANTDQFMRRLAGAFDRKGIAVRERTRVIPQLGHDVYLRVNLACDAMLDTLHWSGGNTSLDALACGLPVVTLPGAFMRGRQSAGMLSLLGVPELIARDRTEYIAIATRLVAEPAWRQALAARIRAERPRLFDVPDAIVRLQELLEADASRAT